MVVVVVAVEAAAGGHLTPVCEDGGARLERAELVTFVREHPRKHETRQPGHRGERRAPVRQTRQQPPKPLEQPAVAERQLEVEIGEGAVDAAAAQRGVRVGVARELEQEAPG